ncbi:hypothetical protein [Bradyrhizobium sp. Ai1a-2]|uniref:hypothetical protein n=1 Tax=Bradyrhizobium sp. Ai1a-2 TaxID=196490 RepID=UPI0004859480|nr:hypothetical protein [Bradyrhizobium sp. Ai1a-2]
MEGDDSGLKGADEASAYLAKHFESNTFIFCLHRFVSYAFNLPATGDLDLLDTPSTTSLVNLDAPSGRPARSRYVAKFADGRIQTESVRNIPVTHGWLARGRLKSGKAWQMYGFSTKSERHALKAMCTSTSHLRKDEATFEIFEVAPVIVEGAPA